MRAYLHTYTQLSWSSGVRCRDGVPKTLNFRSWIFLYSFSWCSDVAFLIVGYRSGAPLVFQRPLNFPFQIFFSGSVRCSGVPKTPKFQISDFRLFLLGVRPTELGERLLRNILKNIFYHQIFEKMFFKKLKKRFVKSVYENFCLKEN